MADINFPPSPSTGTTYPYNGIVYTYHANGYWYIATPGTFGVATSAEIDAGTDGVKYVTPLFLEGSGYVDTAELSTGLSGRAIVDGNSSQAFSVATATLPWHAPRKEQMDAADNLRALLAGNSSQVFSVDTATAAAHAVTKAQLDATLTPPAVAGYVAARTMYLGSAGGDQNQQVLTTTSQIYGPTGSGADVIWPALDILPSDAKGLYVYNRMMVTIANDTGGSVQLYARDGAGAATGSGTLLSFYAPDGTTGDRFEQSDAVWIPLDGLQRFSAQVGVTAATSSQISLRVKGFAV
jgi:hypothetical protein